jgi:dipeptidyl aminopeptidase/acylaminoacyl peptidase
MRRAVLLLWMLCLWMYGGNGLTQTLTDPKALISPVRTDFVPADPKVLAALDEPSYPSWSPDGRFVAYTSYRSGPANVWLTEVTTSKSRLASGSETWQLWPQWSPDGKRILYLSDKGGDEIYDIYLIEVPSGQTRNLTQTADIAETCAGWSPDGRQIVFSSRSKESPSGEIAVVDIASGATRFLTSGGPADRTRVGPIWAATGEHIYYYDRAWSLLDANIMRVKVTDTNAVPENLTPHGGESVNRLADVSRDGRYVLYSSDEGTGWMNIALLDTQSRKQQWITNEKAHHSPASFSRDGKHFAFTRDEALATHIFVHDITSRRTQQVSRGEGMHELANAFQRATLSLGAGRSPFSPDDKRLVYLHGGTRPGDIVTVGTDGKAREVLVNSTPAGMARSFVAPVAVSFESSDRRFQIPALVWIPPNLKRDASHPAVIEIHGGPADQTRPYLNLYIQVLVARGYVVISPNYRGSVNQGREFQRANQRDPAGGELSDVFAAADWLRATGYIDSKRMAVYGGSYGGYLTLMALALQPDRWAAGVALVPVADLKLAYATSAPWMQAYDRAQLGDPVRDAALWRERSPLTHAAKIRAPLLMNAGVNDPRTPIGQIREMERAVRTSGGRVELHVRGDSGHFAADTEAYVDENTMVVNFLDRHLRSGLEQSPAQP